MKNVLVSDIPTCQKVFDQCVLPVLTYSAQTLTLSIASAEKLRVTQRKMDRAILGLSLKDHVTNQALRRRTRVSDIIERITALKRKREVDEKTVEVATVYRQMKQRKTAYPLERRPKKDKT